MRYVQSPFSNSIIQFNVQQIYPITVIRLPKLCITLTQPVRPKNYIFVLNYWTGLALASHHVVTMHFG